MSRPKRKAAQDAVSKIQDVYHWENLSESSQEFQKCAEQIEKEFANEGSKKRSWFDAKTGNFTESFTDSECSSDENCDSDENESIDSDSEYSDDSFVVHDINYNSDDDYAQDTDGDNKYLQTSDEESESSDRYHPGLSLSLSLLSLSQQYPMNTNKLLLLLFLLLLLTLGLRSVCTPGSP